MQIHLKVYYLTILLFSFGNCLSAQVDRPLTIGKIETIHSKILNENRDFWIHLPDNGASGKNYPVLYLLDGGSHFYSVVGMMRQLSAMNGNTVCPQMIVVGIPNTNRTRDLTPTRARAGQLFVDSTLIANSGGGEEFIAFLEKELMPYVEANYPTEPYRMFIGHSLGGLTVMHALVHHPNLFQSYVAIDPAMNWDEEFLLKKIKAGALGTHYPNKALYLAIANTMEPDMDTSRVWLDTTFATAHIRSILALDHHLKEQAGSNIRYRGKYYGDDDHTSVPLIAEYDAFRFIFASYQFRISYEDYIDPESDMYERVIDHYRRLSAEWGYRIRPQEDFVNNLGHAFLNLDQFAVAGQLFQLNVENYPTSFRVYDSLGDYYRTLGDKENAITNYRRALSLNENASSAAKLEKLLKK
ncbi:MAG: alpha/beta hydrolase-fold protein [Saprospiraceae bacterium]